LLTIGINTQVHCVLKNRTFNAFSNNINNLHLISTSCDSGFTTVILVGHIL